MFTVLNVFKVILRLGGSALVSHAGSAYVSEPTRFFRHCLGAKLRNFKSSALAVPCVSSVWYLCLAGNTVVLRAQAADELPIHIPFDRQRT